MKPITADSRLGIVLLALRAGSMTADQLSERWPTGHAVSDAVRAGLVEVVGGGYRLTEAGRVAVPLRNPLAAPGMVRPITESMENAMREPNLSRQQVLAVVKEAGATGISKADIVAKLDHLAPENAITSHLVILKKNGEIDNPKHGIWVASDAGRVPPRKVVENATGKVLHATRDVVLNWLGTQEKGIGFMPIAIAQGIGCTEDSTRAVLAGLFAGMKIDREAVGADFAFFLPKPKADLSEKVEFPIAEPVTTSALVSQISAAQVDPLSSQIMKIVCESAEALSAGQIRDRLVNPPDRETVTREIHLMKKAGRLEHDDSATPPAGSRGNVGMYRPAGWGPTIKREVKQEDEETPLNKVLAAEQISPAVDYPVVEDTHLADPDEVEFAVFSSGGMDIYCGESTVTLSKPVLIKLRRFLGLFQEAA